MTLIEENRALKKSIKSLGEAIDSMSGDFDRRISKIINLLDPRVSPLVCKTAAGKWNISSSLSQPSSSKSKQALATTEPKIATDVLTVEPRLGGGDGDRATQRLDADSEKLHGQDCTTSAQGQKLVVSGQVTDEVLTAHSIDGTADAAIPE